MLKQRVWTAICLLPIVILLIFFAPPWLYVLVLSLIFAASAYEWQKLAKFHHVTWIVLWWLALFLVAFALLHVALVWILTASLIGWLIAFLLVLRFPKNCAWFSRYPSLQIFAGLWLLLPAWLALIDLRTAPQGSFFILCLLLLVWGADVGAYFAGRFCGKHLLAKEVSPKKTIEGLIGGLILALLAGGIMLYFIHPSFITSPWLWLLLCLTILISVLGDLTESMFKRIQQVKDSGAILPGHGGFLDRLDSLFAAAPLFTLGLMWCLPIHLGAVVN